MAKQIIITQGNYGIGICNTFVNNNKEPKNITGYECYVDVVYPDNTTDTFLAEIVDYATGKVLFILSDKETEQVGLHKLYFNLKDSNSYITAKDSVFYYVLEDKGGA
jgi:hypothetical protein